jgi:hypothetical protein
MKTHPNDSASNLTKREYFAAMALQGLLSDSNSKGSYKQFVKDAVKMADALIEELNENQ